MPHVDELLGPATFAAAGLFAAIALQPADPAPARPQASVAARSVVRLPAVEVVGRRGPDVAAGTSAKPKASG